MSVKFARLTKVVQTTLSDVKHIADNRVYTFYLADILDYHHNKTF